MKLKLTSGEEKHMSIKNNMTNLEFTEVTLTTADIEHLLYAMPAERDRIFRRWNLCVIEKGDKNG